MTPNTNSWQSRIARWTFTLGFLGMSCSLRMAAESLAIEFLEGATNLTLISRDARQQVLATADGQRDVTRTVRWSSNPEGILRIDSTGRLFPLANGSTVLRATTTNGATAEFPVQVTHAEEPARREAPAPAARHESPPPAAKEPPTPKDERSKNDDKKQEQR